MMSMSPSFGECRGMRRVNLPRSLRFCQTKEALLGFFLRLDPRFHGDDNIGHLAHLVSDRHVHGDLFLTRFEVWF